MIYWKVNGGNSTKTTIQFCELSYLQDVLFMNIELGRELISLSWKQSTLDSF